jgi:hypothetical protein
VALAQLRHGDIDTAVRFYADNQRITFDPDPTETLAGMVRAWASDTQAGHDSLMLAWRRHSVSQLNRLARHTARRLGWLTGPDLMAPGGRYYAVGDQVVTLAPNHDTQLVTSQRAQVVAVDHHARSLTVHTDDHRQVVLAGDVIDVEHLDHGYALTVHREQGATSDRAHVLAEGGGRQLTYVALSRARHHTTIHTTADTHDQAIENLTDDWTTNRDQPWLTPTTRPGQDPRTQPLPADRPEVAALRQRLDQLQQPANHRPQREPPGLAL